MPRVDNASEGRDRYADSLRPWFGAPDFVVIDIGVACPR